MQYFQGKKKTHLVLVAIILSGLFGFWLNNGDSPEDVPLQTHAAPQSTEPNGQELVLHTTELFEQDSVYVCPMMCIPARQEHGDCPVCGMELVPVLRDAADSGLPQLKLSEEALKLAEIETSPVERKFVTAAVRLFGRVDYDPAHVTKIATFMPGVIDRVYVKRAGQFVRWGDPLFDLYSSDLLQTQKQLIEVMRYVPSFMAYQAGSPHAAREMPVQEVVPPGDTPTLESKQAMEKLTAIRHKLRILGLPKRDVDELMKVGEATGIATIYSSIYGQVIDQQAFEGAFVNTGTPIFTLGDPNYVWVMMDSYESDYAWLRKGQAVSFETDAYPGETFTAKSVYIDPVFNTATRTFTVGAISPETGGRLKAGMLVRAKIHARLTAEGNVAREDEKMDKAPLVIPASAPLITGKRAVVYVQSPDDSGRFTGREITLGPRAGSYYLVLAGLMEGEQIVKNGSFKIDSELQIQAKPSLMSMKGGHPAVGHHSPGSSDVLEHDYMIQRAKSRQPVVRDEIKDSGSPSKGSDASGRRTIQRRRPGAYGDIMRRGQ